MIESTKRSKNNKTLTKIYTKNYETKNQNYDCFNRNCKTRMSMVLTKRTQRIIMELEKKACVNAY